MTRAAPPAAPAAAPLTLIAPPSGWPLPDVGELWRHRELLLLFAWRDVAVRYKQTLLGVAWAVVQPALMMAVFTVVLGRLAGPAPGGLPYPLFVLSGLIAWGFFAATLTSASNSVLGAERLLGKVYFPRLAVPLSAVGPATLDLAVGLGLLTLVAGGYALAGVAVTPGWQLLLVPVFAGLLLMAGVGLGTAFAALSVAYRDVRVVVPFLVQLGLFATPAVYLTAGGGWASALNPIDGLVAGFRAGLLGCEVAWGPAAYGAAAAMAVFAGGCAVFRRMEDSFADVI